MGDVGVPHEEKTFMITADRALIVTSDREPPRWLQEYGHYR